MSLYQMILNGEWSKRGDYLFQEHALYNYRTIIVRLHPFRKMCVWFHHGKPEVGYAEWAGCGWRGNFPRWKELYNIRVLLDVVSKRTKFDITKIYDDGVTIGVVIDGKQVLIDDDEYPDAFWDLILKG